MTTLQTELRAELARIAAEEGAPMERVIKAAVKACEVAK